MNRRHFIQLSAGGIAASLTACGKKEENRVNAQGKPIIRFGHFPNVTHVHGLVAHQLSRQGKGWFESRLDAEIEWNGSFNAGPAATESIIADRLDVTYIGPSPTLNGYHTTKGKDIRILAGAANGGSALVVRKDSGIVKPEDFRGKKIGSPQLGNTQDVQIRAWLLDQGFKVTLKGDGDTFVVPTPNSNLIDLFTTKGLDAAWTAEPWVSRLEVETGAKVFLEDKDTNVTLLIARAKWLNNNKDLAKKLVAAHKDLTAWILANTAEAKKLVKAELNDLKMPAKDEILERAFPRVILTDVISRESLDKMVKSAQKVGFYSDIPALDDLLPAL
ncbi:MAG TPA: ABC transporter substrate-binding protein [Verrucomicrobiales bacterium]|nr:ABC transporter substrate-binding protein [Verrucomicrobiales bacterium]